MIARREKSRVVRMASRACLPSNHVGHVRPYNFPGTPQARPCVILWPLTLRLARGLESSERTNHMLMPAPPGKIRTCGSWPGCSSKLRGNNRGPPDVWEAAYRQTKVCLLGSVSGGEKSAEKGSKLRRAR